MDDRGNRIVIGPQFENVEARIESRSNSTSFATDSPFSLPLLRHEGPQSGFAVGLGDDDALNLSLLAVAERVDRLSTKYALGKFGLSESIACTRGSRRREMNA